MLARTSKMPRPGQPTAHFIEPEPTDSDSLSGRETTQRRNRRQQAPNGVAGMLIRESRGQY